MKRLVLFCLAAAAGNAQTVELKKASTHPMQYYLSLPEGWAAGQRYPVVVAIESANRDFQGNAQIFARARGKMPFVIVVPMVVTNGGAAYRSVATYRYGAAEWAEIDRVGDFHFDEAGIAAVIADVKRLYGGEDRYFLTGWEAGGHTVWALLFQRPERLRAVAPVSTNYAGRWMSPQEFSAAPERAHLPVKVFLAGGLPSTFLSKQTAAAMDLARQHGYGNVSLATVEKPHGPLADEAMQYFGSLLAK